MKIWRLTPEQIANYTWGMDLGPPHEIWTVKTDRERSREEAQAIRERQQRSIERRMRGKVRLTQELYSKEVAAGLSKAQIAEKYGLKVHTVDHYRHLWRKMDRQRGK